MAALDPYLPLDQRVTALEGLFNDQALPLDALPLAQIGRALENSAYSLDGGDLLREKSVTAKEIGTLPTARVYGGTSLTASGFLNQIFFTTIDYDTDRLVKGAGPYGVFQIKTPGRYVLAANSQWEVGGAGVRIVQINWTPINGSGMVCIARDAKAAALGAEMEGSVAAEVFASIGDVFSVWEYQSNGGNLNFGGGSYAPVLPNFTCTWVGS